mgnify:CR=1 FL=1
MIVAKFGGTSVADAAAIRRTGEIVRGRLGRAPVIVVSALAGMIRPVRVSTSPRLKRPLSGS